LTTEQPENEVSQDVALESPEEDLSGESKEIPSPVDPGLPRQSFGKRIRRWALLLFFVYAGLCVMLAIIQRKLIYFPAHETSLTAKDLQLPPGRFRDVTVKTTDGLTLHGWHVLPPGRSVLDEQERKWELELGRPVILFFSGNAGHRGYRSEELDRLSGLNADVFLIDYRGYGENSGIPSEENFLRDARSVWDHLVQSERISPRRILILGESLGGGVATALASSLASEGIEPGGIFLKTTFSSMVDEAAYQYPWVPCRLLLTERYPSAQKIKNVTCPITILHGINDEIIPFFLAQRLYEAAPDYSKSHHPKVFVELPAAGHNDVLEVDGKFYLESVQAMLNGFVKG